MTITEFLLARIAEDEEVARAASHQKVAGPFHGDWRHNSLHLAGMEREDAIHIARHDPARVLAECAAKRAIIGVRNAMAANHPKDGSIGWYQVNCYDTVIETIAAVYKDHPDYQPDWAL